MWRNNINTMFGLFQKTPKQHDVLGSDLFSKEEFSLFFELIHKDLKNRNFSIKKIKSGFLFVKTLKRTEQIGLFNLAQTCTHEDKNLWPEIIKKHFDMMDDSAFEERLKNDDFETNKELLAVQLYPINYFEAVKMSKDDFITKIDIPEVLTTVVFDLPTTIQTVKNERLTKWNKTADEVLSIALANTLQKLQPEVFEQQLMGEKFFLISSENILTAVVALRLQNFAQCNGEYGSLFSVPTRNAVLCYPIHNLGVVEFVYHFINMTIKLNNSNPGPITTNIYWNKNGAFTPLPYQFENNNIQFSPPESFTNLLNSLKK